MTRRSVSLFNLDATLESGQAFCWRREKEEWLGWIGSHSCRIRQKGSEVWFDTSASESEMNLYFQWDRALEPILATFPDDPWLKQACSYAPGLRVLKQDPWETTVNFICSALKQIVQIQQINGHLRKRFGERMDGDLWRFPDVAALAQVSESDLRECKLGFRAQHLYRAAKQIDQGEVALSALENMSTAEARQELLKLAGVGEKVANCILLFAYARYDAFPVDVWVERVLRELYFAKKRRVTRERLRRFTETYFGPYAGYAQQYLFHWIRTKP